MPGIKLKLDTTFSATGLPKFKEDPILAAGSLWLFDVRTALPASGVPAGGSDLYNTAWKQAAALIGSGSQASLSAKYDLTAGADQVIERSGKKGLHVISKPTAMAAGVGLAIQAADAIKQYLLDHPGHSYYISMWHKGTRASGAPSSAHRLFHVGRASGTLWSQGSMCVAYNSSTGRLAGWYALVGTAGKANMPDGLRASNTSTTYPLNDHIYASWSASASAPYWGCSSTTLTPPTTVAELNLGTFFGRKNFGAVDGDPSRVLYRVYFEDLTASGRTAADAYAIDSAMYTAAFATGGDFAGDTYTEPTAVFA